MVNLIHLQIENKLKEKYNDAQATSYSITVPTDAWKYILKCKCFLLKNIEEANKVAFQESLKSSRSTLLTATTSSVSATPSLALETLANLVEEVKKTLRTLDIEVPVILKNDQETLLQCLQTIRGMYFNLLVDFDARQGKVHLCGYKNIVKQGEQDLKELWTSSELPKSNELTTGLTASVDDLSGDVYVSSSTCFPNDQTRQVGTPYK